MRLRLDPWSADFGPSVALLEEEDESEACFDVELPRGEWKPLEAEGEPPSEIALVDGVRRVDAYLRLEDGAHSFPAMLGTLAAGAVCLRLGEPRDMRAALGGPPVVKRVLFSLCPELHLGALPADLPLPGGYETCAVAGDAPEALLQRLQNRMRAEEALVCSQLAHPFVLADGPIHYILKSAGCDLVGFIKSHRRMLLPDDLVSVLTELAPGQRTPLLELRRLLEGSQHVLYTWYLRLAAPSAHETSLAGIARLEVLGELGKARALELARLTSLMLPRLVGGRYRDPRAPQNLVPIAALERELKRRLGDPGLVARIVRTWVRGNGAN